MSGLYQQILDATAELDQSFSQIPDEDLVHFHASFEVPTSHPRAKVLQEYTYDVAPMETAFVDKKTLVIIDAALQDLPWVTKSIPTDATVYWITPVESETKNCAWIDAFIEEHKLESAGIEVVVAVGGGIITNVSAYIAEKIGSDLIYVPTTVLSMSDGAIGGKVRANRVEGASYQKHTHKSFYEPNRIVVDSRFLEALPDAQIRVGMGEIIKHGVYQSRPLLQFLASDQFDPFNDRAVLLRSILWAAALKAVCLDIDPEETKEGSHIIMRGAHEASDKIEEGSKFTIPHGTAVALAIRNELMASKSELLPYVETCFKKFRIADEYVRT